MWAGHHNANVYGCLTEQAQLDRDTVSHELLTLSVPYQLCYNYSDGAAAHNSLNTSHRTKKAL